jgi:putative Ca2+/H+ antiporter (TMEM165/GDT1 family)
LFETLRKTWDVYFETIRNKRDVYAGGLMVLIGISVALDSLSYDLGTLTDMGPGMFPLMLGIILTVIGMVIFGIALATPSGESERILPGTRDWRGWGCILAGPILFIILGDYLGLVPAVFACVFVSALGDRSATFKGSLVLAACVAIFGSLLFTYVLNVPFPLFQWGG